MPFFVAPDFAEILRQEGLRTFDDVWGLERNWREPPNFRRGGTSGVCRMEWNDPATGKPSVFFVKFQENHTCRGWTNPLGDMPTARREFRNQRILRKNGILTKEEAYYAENIRWGRVRAIMVTRALPGTDLIRYLERRPFDEALSAALAGMFYKIHKLGFRHGALEPKHVWTAGTEVGVIDLEFSQRIPWRTELPTGELKKFFRNLRKKCGVPYAQQRETLLRYLTLAGKPETIDKWAAVCELKEIRSLRRAREALQLSG